MFSVTEISEESELMITPHISRQCVYVTIVASYHVSRFHLGAPTQPFYET